MTRLAARVIHALRRWGWCVDDVTLDDAINELRAAGGWRPGPNHPWSKQ